MIAGQMQSCEKCRIAKFYMKTANFILTAFAVYDMILRERI